MSSAKPRWEPSPEVRALLDHAPITILVRDTDGNYLFANEQARDRVGLTWDEVRNTTAFDVFPEDTAKALLEQDLAVIESGTPITTEADLPLPDGTLRSFLLAKYPVVPQPGQATMVATFALDITEQRRLARAFQESELRFRQLTDSIEDVFSLTTVNPLGALYISPSAADVYGVPWEEGEVDPNAFMRNIDPDDVRVVLAMLSEVNRRLVGSEVDFRVHHPERGLRWMRARARPVAGPGGERRIAMVVNDITADRKLETELVRARDVAEEANARKNEFLSQMSHELRTPLNAILGFSQLLELDERRLDPDQVDHVRQIRRAGQHLLDLINDILDITRIERGAVTLAPERFQIDSVALEVCQLLEIQARARTITLDLPPPGDVPLVVVADRQRFTQVLINLVGNAIKYNRLGGRVDVTWQRVGEHVRIAVTDTGAGMTAKDIERLFVPFERLGRTESIEGTGIGLALSRQLVHAMGGTIGVDSQLGSGTTFTVELPQEQTV